MFKVNNKNTGQHQWLLSAIFVVNFEYISYLFLVFLLLSLNKKILARTVFDNSIYLLHVEVFQFSVCCVSLKAHSKVWGNFWQRKVLLKIKSIFHHFWRAIIETNKNFFLKGESPTLSKSSIKWIWRVKTHA